MSEMSEYVYRNRKQLGITQAELASRLGVARTTVVAIEQGIRRLRASELAMLKTLGFPDETVQQPMEPVTDSRWMRVTDDERMLIKLFRNGRIEKVLRLCLAAKDQRLAEIAQELANEELL